MNNSRFKFRAWDNKDKIMWEPLSFSELLQGGWELQGSGLSLPHKDYLDFADGDTIWMQYTGIKDKNGNEIFEEDIIEYKHVVFRVYWSGFNYSLEPLGEHPTEFMNWKNINQTMAAKIACDGQIIGNTFENPELLGEEQ